MSDIVLDSSVMVKLINATRESDIDQANDIIDDAKNDKIVLFAPELSKYEVGNALLKGKKLSLSDGIFSLNNFYSLPIEFVTDTQQLAESAYQIGQEFNITYYDAAFVALAESLGAVLVTDNVKHQQSSKYCKVLSLANYTDAPRWPSGRTV